MENIKKIIGIFTLAVALTMTGCKEQTVVEPAEKDVIVVPAEPVVIEKEVIIEKEAPPKSSTTVTLDKNGAAVEVKKVE